MKTLDSSKPFRHLTRRLSENNRAVWHLFRMRSDTGRFKPNLEVARQTRQTTRKNGTDRHGQTVNKTAGPKNFPSFRVLSRVSRAPLWIHSPGYKRLWSADRLKAYRESFKDLKGNAQVCATTVGLSQTLLLADRSAMDHILETIRKIKAHSAELAKGIS